MSAASNASDLDAMRLLLGQTTPVSNDGQALLTEDVYAAAGADPSSRDPDAARILLGQTTPVSDDGQASLTEDVNAAAGADPSSRDPDAARLLLGQTTPASSSSVDFVSAGSEHVEASEGGDELPAPRVLYPDQGDNASSAPDPKPASKLSASESRRKKSEDIARKNERQRLWAGTLELSHVILTEDKSDVQTLGGVPWKDLKMKAREEFMKANNIARNANLGKAIANFVNAGAVKTAIVAQNRAKAKKKNPTVRPKWIKKDDTLYRLVNVITREKQRGNFMATRRSHDATDQDTRKPHNAAWGFMAQDYSSDDELLLVIASDARPGLVGFCIDENICHDYDECNQEEFQSGATYLLAVYRVAMNERVKSGNHKAFSAYCSGATWLLYFHLLLQSIGDTMLSQCAYPELIDDIVRTSAGTFKPLRSGRRGQSRSKSPALGGRSKLPTLSRSSSFDDMEDDDLVPAATVKKADTMHAAKQAADAMAERQAELNRSEQFERIMAIKRAIDKCKRAVSKIEQAYRCEKKKKKSDAFDFDAEKFSTLKHRRKRKRTELLDYKQEYKSMKEVTGYKSPTIPDSSDSSDGSDCDASARE
ncbi:hypothetical protein ACHAWF_016575 [Thalassiosira exigua]